MPVRALYSLLRILQEEEQQTRCALNREMNKTTESEVSVLTALARKSLRDSLNALGAVTGYL